MEFKRYTNGDIMLSKEEAINEHRKMWNWIADKAKEKKDITKLDYIKDELGIGINYLCDKDEEIKLKGNCFLCEYAYERSREEIKKGKEEEPYCKYCPLDWGGKNRTLTQCLDKDKENKGGGLYDKYLKTSSYGCYKTVEKLARQIANLKEI